MEIDAACERAMIQFVYSEKTIRFVNLDTIWKVFRTVYPVPDEVSVSDLKIHFLCMDKSSNRWELEEDVFMYLKFGSWAEKVGENAEEDAPGDSDDTATNKLLVTFDRKQSLMQGPSWDSYKLFHKAFDRDDSLDI